MGFSHLVPDPEPGTPYVYAPRAARAAPTGVDRSGNYATSLHILSLQRIGAPVVYVAGVDGIQAIGNRGRSGGNSRRARGWSRAWRVVPAGMKSLVSSIHCPNQPRGGGGHQEPRRAPISRGPARRPGPNPALGARIRPPESPGERRSSRPIGSSASQRPPAAGRVT